MAEEQHVSERCLANAGDAGNNDEFVLVENLMARE